MISALQNKVKEKVRVYKQDVKTKGLYWSIIHRLYKLPNGKKILFPIVSFFKPSYVNIEGHKMYIIKSDDTVSEELIINKTWESLETEVFKQNIKNGDTVIDLGANLGYYSLIAARIVGEKGKVYAFEPDEENFQILEKNIKANNYKNIIPVKMAVSDKIGNIKLYLSPGNKGDHRIYDQNAGRNTVTIKSTTLDNYFKNQKVDLIKIDIQGSEMDAIKGAKKIINANKNIKVITEYQAELLEANNSKPVDYLNLLTSLGFELYDINQNTNKLIRTTTKELINNYPSAPFVYTNILCKK